MVTRTTQHRPPPTRTVLSVEVPHELHAALAELAAADDRTVSSLVRVHLRELVASGRRRHTHRPPNARPGKAA